MQPEDIKNHIERLRIREQELAAALADPGIYAKQDECRRLGGEQRKLESLFADFSCWENSLRQISENRSALARENDPEMRALLELDIEELEKRSAELEEKVQLALLPPEPNDSKNIIVEIKPAAGGDEAALFAADLYRAYLYFAEKEGWKVETLDHSATDLGGVKDVSFSVSGADVFSLMKYESGVHRVQRIPSTEAGGRIHTSTVTVSVMPEAEAVELDLDPEDLRFDVFRSSGPGGQCVNTTDSAVRVTHIPTGVSVASQQEKSQHRNKEIALRILYARLLEHKQQEEAARVAADKRSQVGT
ncbi:MAG: PCRF domain-containing protein, partial [Lentisphaeria bacterium]|nr:PCRF domain-containing protein [Lentisphaeria bacterium]